MGRLLFILMGMFLIGGWWFWFGKTFKAPVVFENVSTPSEVGPVSDRSLDPVVEPPKDPVIEKRVSSIQYQVPFTSQAPTGDWSRSAFQDGCEEASTLMVSLARTGKTMTRDAMRLELLEMAEFQTKTIGHGVDTDATDTHEYLLKQYFEITDARVETDITLSDLKEALLDGLVIVPTNGRALGNPNFTPPGPIQHMLVITGYNLETKEFITNDPGTRKGEGYRYAEQVLYDAIREYPTGKHLPIKTERKVMIVVPFEEGASPRTNAQTNS